MAQETPPPGWRQHPGPADQRRVVAHVLPVAAGEYGAPVPYLILLNASEEQLAAIVTRESTDTLGLRVQQTVIAMVKASSVLLATELGDAKLSARNRLDGQVQAVRPGAVNAEVSVEAAGLQVVAIVTQASVDALGLAPGRPVTALVKASDVILATID